MKYYIAKDTCDYDPVVFTKDEVYDYEKERASIDKADYFDEFCEQEELSYYEVLYYDPNELNERYTTWYINYMTNREWIEVELSKDTIQSIKNGD